MVRVAEKQQIRRLAHINTAVAEGEFPWRIQSVGEHGDLIRAAIVIRVFKNLDAVARFAPAGAPRGYS